MSMMHERPQRLSHSMSGCYSLTGRRQKVSCLGVGNKILCWSVDAAGEIAFEKFDWCALKGGIMGMVCEETRLKL